MDNDSHHWTFCDKRDLLVRLHPPYCPFLLHNALLLEHFPILNYLETPLMTVKISVQNCNAVIGLWNLLTEVQGMLISIGELTHFWPFKAFGACAGRILGW